MIWVVRRMKLLYVIFLLGFTSATAESLLDARISKAVLSKINCENPLIILNHAPVDIDLEAAAKEDISIISISEIKLSPKKNAYRVDFENLGAGNYRSYHQALYELEENQLKHVFTFSGPYLFISKKIRNGRFTFWHWKNYPKSEEKIELQYDPKSHTYMPSA